MYIFGIITLSVPLPLLVDLFESVLPAERGLVS